MTKQEEPFYGKFVKPKSGKTAPDKKEKKEKKQSRAKKKFGESAEGTFFKPEKRKKTKPVKLEVCGPALFAELDGQTAALLNSFGTIVKEALRLTKKQESVLPKEIRILFHELTDERGSRKTDYLNNPAKLSAYIHYYMWWNLVRLSKLVKNIFFDLSDGDVIADFGAGPLTAACAFWIAKPELRQKKLEWYCIDISAKALSAGEKIFDSLCRFTEKGGECRNWKITKIKGAFGMPLKKKADLFFVANMFNEIFWNSAVTVQKEAEKAAQTVLASVNGGGRICIVEPGIPLSGEFVSALRSRLLKRGCSMSAPCPHNGVCPIPGIRNFRLDGYDALPHAKGKWCHFAFAADNVPEKLAELSHGAGLEKQRAAVSFLYCTTPSGDSSKTAGTANSAKKSVGCTARITSDLIRIDGGRIGRYACSEKGFLLFQERNSSSAKLKKLPNGAAVRIEESGLDLSVKDRKSGAVLVEI